MSPPPYIRLDKNDCCFAFVDHQVRLHHGGDDVSLFFADFAASYQTGLCNLVRDFSPDEFRNNVTATIECAKYFKAPCVLTTSFENGPNGPLVSEFKDAFPKDTAYIPRPGQVNAMDNEDFVKAIEKTGKKQIVLSGVLTEICVAFPALSLVERGYDVFVITDASGTFNPGTREAAHKRMQAAGVQLMNWVAVAAELHRDWRNDIEGFGNIWGKYVAGYKLVMDSYAGAQAQK